MSQLGKLRKVADLAQLAAILEASSFKPGNVDPLHDFRDTLYEDFLFGAISMGSAMEDSAIMGFMAGEGKIPLSNIGIGMNIKKAVSDVKKSRERGNTHLGIAMLFVPISAGAGICIAKNYDFQKYLQKNILNIIKNSTIRDSVNLYSAIKIANAGGLKGKLIEKNITFYKLMKISAKKDRVSEELINGMRIVFDIGLPYLGGFYGKSGNIRKSITKTYLQILAEFPDTLILKKAGLKKAEKVSRNARLVLEGRKNIEEFDRELRPGNNELNPGTTADIVAASVFLWLLMKEF